MRLYGDHHVRVYTDSPSRCLRPGRGNLELFSGTPPIAAVAAWHGHSAEEMLRTYAHAVEESLTSAGATMFTEPGEVAG